MPHCVHASAFVDSRALATPKSLISRWWRPPPEATCGASSDESGVGNVRSNTLDDLMSRCRIFFEWTCASAADSCAIMDRTSTSGSRRCASRCLVSSPARSPPEQYSMAMQRCSSWRNESWNDTICTWSRLRRIASSFRASVRSLGEAIASILRPSSCWSAFRLTR